MASFAVLIYPLVAIFVIFMAYHSLPRDGLAFYVALVVAIFGGIGMPIWQIAVTEQMNIKQEVRGILRNDTTEDYLAHIAGHDNVDDRRWLKNLEKNIVNKGLFTQRLINKHRVTKITGRIGKVIENLPRDMTDPMIKMIEKMEIANQNITHIVSGMYDSKTDVPDDPFFAKDIERKAIAKSLREIIEDKKALHELYKKEKLERLKL